MTAPLPHRCRTCNHPLVGVQLAGDKQLRWIHGTEVDHEADPIPDRESTARRAPLCDFCSEDNPPWVYETDPTKPKGFETVGITYNDDGFWGACDACHDLIEAGAWPLLVERSAREIGRRRGVRARDLKPDIVTLHRYFRAVVKPGARHVA